MKINYLCVGCGQCAAICKKDAIDVMGRAEFNDRCNECSSCVQYCPLKAIEV